MVNGGMLEIDAEAGEEQLVERVAAIDVAKASAVVCVRVAHASIAGRRVTRVWEVHSTTNAIIALAEGSSARIQRNRAGGNLVPRPLPGRTSCHSARVWLLLLRRPAVALSDNEEWSLYGAPWLQPVAISRKSTERRSGRNKPKPLPWVATSCRNERMVRVVPPTCERGGHSPGSARSVKSCESEGRQDLTG